KGQNQPMETDVDRFKLTEMRYSVRPSSEGILVLSTSSFNRGKKLSCAQRVVRTHDADIKSLMLNRLS
ncbi:unnamed protein product, partial [Ceratitis capitata]